MLYNIHYNVCAAVVTAIIMAFFVVRNRVSTQQNKLFLVLAASVEASVLLDIAGQFAQSYRASFSYAVHMVLTLLYFVSRLFLVLALSLYVISLTGRRRSRMRQFGLLLVLPFGIFMVGLLCTPWTGFVFTLDAANTYMRSSGILLNYLVAFGYLVFCVAYTFHNRRVIEGKVRRSVYYFVILSVVPVGVQFFFPEIVIEGFGLSLCLLFMYLAIQRPEKLNDTDTDLSNREAWLTTLSARLLAERQFCTLVVCIDDYSLLTQTLGLATMRSLAQRVAGYLAQVFGRNAVFRIDDNEFAMLLDGVSAAQALQKARQVAERFKTPWQCGDSKLRLTSKVCVIDCPSEAATTEEVLGCIETAEAAGGTELLLARELDRNVLQRSNGVRMAVSNALSEGGLSVYYQPIYCCASGRIEAAEALVRLHDPRLGNVPPDEFIPIAESSGQILRVGRFVLDSVCRFCAQEKLEQRGVRFIDVNLSMVECMQDGLAGQIAATLERFGVHPRQINLEVTETAQGYSLETFMNNVEQLCAGGFRLSLDDFGTGYSTMKYLLDLPFSTVKLDKSIVWAAFESDKAREMLESIVQMILKMGMSIVAEGVETAEQAAFLERCGCEYLQGYHFSHPLTETAFLQLLESLEPVR